MEKLAPHFGKMAVTTNGLLLPDHLDRLLAAGLHHYNVSLDTLRKDRFTQITRRSGFRKTLDILQTLEAHARTVKVNAVIMTGLNDDELLDFLDHLETYERFMRVPSLKLTSASRSELEKQGKATHRVQLDVETFVYEPKAGAEKVVIEGYERKRDLLLGEINRRKQALTVSNYAYRGDRGRRDPWVDPRAPVNGDGESALSVQEQMAIVEDLSERTQSVLQIWEDVKAADNVIEEIKLRADLEDSLTALEIDVRRVEAEAGIRFVPSQRRMQLEVLDALAGLRSELMSDENGLGPSSEMLREVLDGMIVHLEKGEYQLMLDA
ncbi:MAG: radical SAM protein, partial [Planctomycetota bacterium]